MSYIRSQAIVLRVTDYGESDKIVIFFSRNFGKLKAIAKGAKRSKKRFVNKLEFFSLLDITLIPSRLSTLSRVDSAELLNPFPQIRENYHHFTAAMLISELVEQWTRENDADESLFDLLNWSLHALAGTGKISETVIFFQLKMLDILGMGLQLDQCLVCGKTDWRTTSCFFSPTQSGFLCSNCLGPNHFGLTQLSISSVKSMQMARSLPLSRLSRLKISKNNLIELATILKLYCNFQLQREIHSWKHFDLFS